MCKRRNTSASRVLFWSNTTALFCIDVWTAQYIRKSGAILKQHYNHFLYRCASGAMHPHVGCYFEATLQHLFVSMCKRRNTSAGRVLFWSNTTTLFCIDVQAAPYIHKSGAILKQHYNHFLHRCAEGAIHPQVEILDFCPKPALAPESLPATVFVPFLYRFLTVF